MFRKSLLAVLFGILAVSACAEIVVAQQTSDDTLFAEGLRSRRLFDLAEKFCRKRLTDRELESATQATLILELIRTQSARAAISTGNERTTNWAAAIKTASDFLKQNPGHPRSLLIEVQSALGQLANGRVLRQEIDADIAASGAAQIALEQLRLANSRLKKIGRDVDRLIPERRRAPAKDDELTIDELGSLKNNVRYQIALCNLTRAQLYPPTDQVNRIDALNVVLGQLNQLQRETPTELPLWWLAQVARVESFRLLEKYAEANQTLGRSNPKDAPGDMGQLVLEQEILLAIATKDNRQSNRLFTEAGKIESRKPQLDLALVQLLLQLARSDVKKKQNWLTQASQLTNMIESQHGPYWGRRAELLLIGESGNSGAATTSSTELDILIRVAEQAVRKDNLDDAYKAFQKAAQMAGSSNNDGQEFVLTVRAAKILEKQKMHAAAANDYVSIAQKHKQLAGSPAAHLLGCWNWSRLFQASAQVPSAEELAKRKKRFKDLLVEHTQFWPESKTTSQAMLWLGASLQDEHQWQSATDTYLSIDPKSTHIATAVVQAIACFDQYLNQLKENEQQIRKVAQDFVERLNAIQKESNDNPDVIHEAVIGRSRFGLSYGVISATEVISELRTALTRPPAQYHSRENAWLIVASVANGESANNITPVIETISDDPALLAECANGLERTASRLSKADQTVSSEIRLQIADSGLRLDEQSVFWVAQRARALEQLGRHGEAVESLETIAEKLPKSASAQMELARGLTRLPGADAAKKALLQWRRVGAKIKPRTENWYEAKYHVALLLQKTGDTKAALKLLEYLKAIPPGWKDSTWSGKFDQLFIKCQN